MTRVAIVGATGYAGAELVRILSGHPEVKLAVLTSRQFAGVRFDQVYPALCRDGRSLSAKSIPSTTFATMPMSCLWRFRTSSP